MLLPTCAITRTNYMRYTTGEPFRPTRLLQLSGDGEKRFFYTKNKGMRSM